jgi:hypothetical protein
MKKKLVQDRKLSIESENANVKNIKSKNSLFDN